MRALVFLFALRATARAEPEVCFTPGQDCTAVVVHEIATAQRSIRLQAYSFTSAPIARALVRAAERGVHVEAILDRSNRTGRYSGMTFLVHADIPTSIDAQHAIAHNKILIVDDETVITGSFNFTKAAQDHNAENLIVIHDAALAKKYAANWRAHLAHSEDVGE